MATRKAAKKPAAPKKKKAAQRPATPAPSPQWETAPPPPPAPASDANTWAMFAHLSAFGVVLVPFGNVFGPLVVWLVKREEPFVNDQGKEAVNFQLSLTLYGLLLVGLIVAGMVGGMFGPEANPMENQLFLLATPFALGFIALLIFALVTIILASVRASQGVAFRYPLRIRFIP